MGKIVQRTTDGSEDHLSPLFPNLSTQLASPRQQGLQMHSVTCDSFPSEVILIVQSFFQASLSLVSLPVFALVIRHQLVCAMLVIWGLGFHF